MSLGSFFQSIFTPPGTHAREAQNAQQQQFGTEAANLGGQLSPLLGQQIGYGSSLEPQREGYISSLLNYLNPNNTGALYSQNANRENEAYGNQMGQTNSFLRNMGYGSGVAGGAAASLGNQAARGEASYGQYLNSPQYQSGLLGSLLGTIGQGQSSPGLGTYGQLAGLSYNAPPVYVGQNFAANLLGAGIGALTGGGGGRGGAEPTAALGGGGGGGGYGGYSPQVPYGQTVDPYTVSGIPGSSFGANGVFGNPLMDQFGQYGVANSLGSFGQTNGTDSAMAAQSPFLGLMNNGGIYPSYGMNGGYNP